MKQMPSSIRIRMRKAAIADMSLLQIAAFARSRQWNPTKSVTPFTQKRKEVGFH